MDDRARLASYEVVAAEDTIALLSDPIMSLVFGPKAVSRRAVGLWNLATDRLGAETAAHARLLAVIIRGATFAGVQACRSAQPVIVGAADRGLDLSPLFEDPLEPGLVDGAVADYIAGLLEAWKQPASSDGDVSRMVGWLLRAIEAGWPGGALIVLAGKVTSDVVAGVNPTDWPRLLELSKILAKAPASTETDDLAAALVPRAVPTDSLPMRLALSLQLTSAGALAMQAEIDSWLRSASIDSALAVVNENSVDAQRHSLDLVPGLERRWAQGDGSAFLEAIYIADATSVANVVAATLSAATDSWARAAEASVIAQERGDSVSLARISSFMESSLVAPLPPASSVREVLASLHASKVSLNDAVQALMTTIGAVGTEDGLDRAADLGPLVAGSNSTAAASIAAAIAERSIALGHLPLGHEAWVIRGSRRAADLAAVVASEVAAAQPAAAIERVKELRSTLSHSSKVGLALLELAASDGIDCADALLLTTEAAEWTKGFKGRRSDVEAALEGIGECEGSGQVIASIRARL